MKMTKKRAIIGSLLILLLLSGGNAAASSLTAVRNSSSPILLGTAGEDAMSSIPQINPEEMPEPPNPATAYIFLLFMLILSVIAIAGMWKVYTKAGEAGWAVLIPIYNIYVLARIGDKPGWMGIAACLVGFIPIAGPIIELVLFIIISIGVARTFGKGALFGLGLCFLSFIFYPILGFGSSRVTGAEAKDYSSGGLGTAGQQFYTPASTTSADLPPIPMPDEPKTQEVPQYKPDIGPAEQKQTKAEKDYIHFTCSCGKRFRVPIGLAGKMGKCPQCKMRIRIPEK